jgi:hypothetical protein
MSQAPEKYPIAVHEAAHVIVAQHLGMPVAWATIAPPARFEYLEEGFGVAWQGAVLCAGYAAQRRIDPLCTIVRDAEEDMFQLARIVPEESERAACLAHAESLTGELWPQIEALARRLVAEGTVRF